eukprot:60125_1
MALPKRPTSLKSNLSNSGKIREWTTTQVAEWMKHVNDGLFAKYVDNVIAFKLNGVDLMNLTKNDMKTKLGINIPNHITTLSATIERLKKKSRRRNKKDPNSPIPKANKPNFDIMHTIPNYKKDKDNDKKINNNNNNNTENDTILPLKNNIQNKYNNKLNKAKSLAYTKQLENDEKRKDDDDRISRAQTVQHKQLNGHNKEISDTINLKKQITQVNRANKKSDKYLHKDLGKKLWPKESSLVIKEGWMKKRGVRRSGFKERWCVLRDNGHLYYFEKRPAVKTDLPQGMLDLDGVKSIEYVENEDPNTFNIKTNDRDWIFVAMSGQHLVEWMSALNKTFKAIHQ